MLPTFSICSSYNWQIRDNNLVNVVMYSIWGHPLPSINIDPRYHDIKIIFLLLSTELTLFCILWKMKLNVKTNIVMIRGVYYLTIYQQLEQQLKIDGDMNIIITRHGLYLSFFHLWYRLFSVQKYKSYYQINRE